VIGNTANAGSIMEETPADKNFARIIWVEKGDRVKRLRGEEVESDKEIEGDLDLVPSKFEDEQGPKLEQVEQVIKSFDAVVDPRTSQELQTSRQPAESETRHRPLNQRRTGDRNERQKPTGNTRRIHRLFARERLLASSKIDLAGHSCPSAYMILWSSS